MLDNAAVARYLSKHYPEMLTEFQKIVGASTLEANV